MHHLRSMMIYFETIFFIIIKKLFFINVSNISMITKFDLLKLFEIIKKSLQLTYSKLE